MLKEEEKKDQVPPPQMATIQIPNATVILAPYDTAFPWMQGIALILVLSHLLSEDRNVQDKARREGNNEKYCGFSRSFWFL